MKEREIHACWAVQGAPDHFRCRKCKFEGDLEGAIRHVVENQWDARAE